MLVCGYSLLGQRTVDALKAKGITYVAIEQERSLVELGHSRGENVYFGNADSSILLNALHIKHATAVIITIDNDEKIRLIVETIHNIDTNIDIILRVENVRQTEELSDLPIKSYVNHNVSTAKLLVEEALKCEIKY